MRSELQQEHLLRTPSQERGPEKDKASVRAESETQAPGWGRAVRTTEERVTLYRGPLVALTSYPKQKVPNTSKLSPVPPSKEFWGKTTFSPLLNV